MKKMNVICEHKERVLYEKLIMSGYNSEEYKHCELGENMTLVQVLWNDYWKPRYLIDHNTKNAYEFMTIRGKLNNVGDEDIDWNSLAGINEDPFNIARKRYALYPVLISPFENGVALVEWQLNPDGYYWMDEDGFGMTNDVELSVYGFIDKSNKVVVPFQTIKNYDMLNEMRKMAENLVNTL